MKDFTLKISFIHSFFLRINPIKTFYCATDVLASSVAMVDFLVIPLGCPLDGGCQISSDQSGPEKKWNDRKCWASFMLNKSIPGEKSWESDWLTLTHIKSSPWPSRRRRGSHRRRGWSAASTPCPSAWEACSCPQCSCPGCLGSPWGAALPVEELWACPSCETSPGRGSFIILISLVHLAGGDHGAELADVGVHLVPPPLLDLAVVLTEKVAAVSTSLFPTMVGVLRWSLVKRDLGDDLKFESVFRPGGTRTSSGHLLA